MEKENNITQGQAEAGAEAGAEATTSGSEETRYVRNAARRAAFLFGGGIPSGDNVGREANGETKALRGRTRIVSGDFFDGKSISAHENQKDSAPSVSIREEMERVSSALKQLSQNGLRDGAGPKMVGPGSFGIQWLPGYLKRKEK